MLKRESPKITDSVDQNLRLTDSVVLGDAIANPQDPRSQSDNQVDNILTARQIEILAFLCEGQPNKSIARKLGVSEKTVKAHITAIFKSLKVVNRTQAAAVAREAGLI